MELSDSLLDQWDLMSSGDALSQRFGSLQVCLPLQLGLKPVLNAQNTGLVSELDHWCCRDQKKRGTFCAVGENPIGYDLLLLIGSDFGLMFDPAGKGKGSTLFVLNVVLASWRNFSGLKKNMLLCLLANGYL